MLDNIVRLATIPSLAQEIAELEEPPKPPYDDYLCSRISIWRGDIARLEVDMIVNFTDSQFSGSQGSDAEVHAAAGPAMTKACRALGRLAEGDTKVTIGYKLPARFIAHTVLPTLFPFTTQPKQILRTCLTRPLRLCQDYSQQSIALSCFISHIDREADVDISRIVMQTLQSFLIANRRTPNPLRRIILVARSDEEEDMYRAMAAIQLVRHTADGPPVAVGGRDGMMVGP